jgi:tetratricopeptide (TPR) repeat protein
LRDGVPEDCPSPILPFVALSCTELHFGRHDEAIRVLDEGRVALAHCHQAEYAQSNLLAVRADFFSAYGDRASALPDAEASLASARRIANPSQLAIALCALGTACFLSDPNRARDAFEESLALTASGASDVNVAEVSVQLAELLAQAGEYRAALTSLRHGIRHADAVGHRPAFAGHLSVAVEVMGHLGRNESAALMDGAVGTHGFGLTLGNQEAHAASLARAHEELGEDRYQQLHAQGAAWSYDDMVAEVLTLIDAVLVDLEASDA